MVNFLQIIFTFAFMEEKTMTTQEAYADFYSWIRADKNKWDSLEMKERRYLRKTASEARLGNQIGNARIENIFGKYAPGRYAWKIEWHIIGY